jgi:hypothetical protein
LTTPQPDELGQTAPIELPGHQPPPSPPVAPTPPEAPPPLVIQPDRAPVVEESLPPPTVPHAATATQQETVFVPLAVSVGDGFKFGCGFFLAMVMAGLAGLVLLALLFVITGLFGLNLPFSR